LGEEASESIVPPRWVGISSDDCNSATAGTTSGSGSPGASGSGGLGGAAREKQVVHERSCPRGIGAW